MSESVGDELTAVSDSSDLEGLAIGLAGMARDLLAQDGVQNTLDRIVAHAVDLVEGCEQAGVLLLHARSRAETAAASGEVVRLSDAAQQELGEGPCFDAAFRTTASPTCRPRRTGGRTTRSAPANSASAA